MLAATPGSRQHDTNVIEYFEEYNNNEVGYHTNNKNQTFLTIKLDSGSSTNLTGTKDRLNNPRKLIDSIVSITGFNKSKSTADEVGNNSDGFKEYYVPTMPPDLTLLCAHEYASQGAAVLMKDGGFVLKLDDQDLEKLKEYLTHFPIWKQLTVHNRTYEIDHTYDSKNQSDSKGRSSYDEEAYSNRANRFFNTKVHVSNGSDRVLSMLMTGLTLSDLRVLVKHQSMDGMPPDLNEKVINSFEHRHGKTPDIITLAIPINRASVLGLMNPPIHLTYVGQRVECDVAEPDYNETDKVDKEKRVRKLMSHGGAIAFALCVDCYSGFIHRVLLNSKANAIEFVRRFVEDYELGGNNIELLAADSGIYTQSKFQVYVPEVEAYLRSKRIKAERAEPENHQRGTPTVEAAIRRVKELTRMAYSYASRNPNFNVLQADGFNNDKLKRLWGELVNWSTAVINMKPCPHDKTKTRYEVYHKKKPNMQDIRLLPIFSVIMVPKQIFDPINGTNQLVSRVALYVGPSLETPGSIRAAIVSKKGRVQILTTSRFTPATDGGGLNIFASVNRGLRTMLEPATVEVLQEEQEEELQQNNNQQHEVVEINEDDEEYLIDRVEQVDHHNIRIENEFIVEPIHETSVQPVDAIDERHLQITLNEVSRPVLNPTTSPAADGSGLDDTGSLRKKKKVSDVERGSKQKTLDVQPNATTDNSNLKRKSKKKKPNKKTKASKSSSKVATSRQDVEGSHDIYRRNYHQTKDRSMAMTAEANVVDSEPNVENDHLDMDSNHIESESYFADWINHNIENNSIYFSFVDLVFYEISADDTLLTISEDNTSTPTTDQSFDEEVGYKAVTQNVPRTFPQALKDSRWGEPARKELNTLFETKAIVEVDKDTARSLIKGKEADLVILFPVYEEKIKDGQRVDKVRLVGDGRTHHSALNTYAATPSREELLVILHIAASMNWVYYHVDEVRAFLSAEYKGGSQKVFTKFKGDDKYYQVLGALYGLKTSPRDYQQKVIERLHKLGFRKLQLCACIFVYNTPDRKGVVIVYDYVDDFIITGNNTELIDTKIAELRGEATTTEPIKNAERILGMEIRRDIDNKVMYVTMQAKIEEVCTKLKIDFQRRRHTPLPYYGYVIHEADIEKLPSEDDKRILKSKEEIHEYLCLVGSLVWISGVRMDILFATMYLAWSTKQPRIHHLKMGKAVLSYLYHTKDIPLVIGGDTTTGNCELIGYSDASLGTGPKGRSIKAHMFKLGSQCGAVTAKCSTTTSVYTSSFEAELDGVTSCMKTASRLMNILNEIGIADYGNVATMYSDNMAMIEFVKGRSMAKGIRHVQLRMFYIREKYAEGKINLEYMSGETIPVDQLTKIGSKEKFLKFRDNILGLQLWCKRDTDVAPENIDTKDEIQIVDEED